MCIRIYILFHTHKQTAKETKEEKRISVKNLAFVNLFSVLLIYVIEVTFNLLMVVHNGFNIVYV